MVPQAQKTTLCPSSSQRNAKKKKKEFDFKVKNPTYPRTKTLKQLRDFIPWDRDPQTSVKPQPL